MSQNINQEMLIFEGKDYEEQLVNLIQQAQCEILITCYILENEKFGEKILNLLLGKSKQGVKVRLVVDGFGSWDWIDKILPKIKQENFEVRLYHPLNWRVLGWKSSEHLCGSIGETIRNFLYLIKELVLLEAEISIMKQFNGEKQALKSLGPAL